MNQLQSKHALACPYLAPLDSTAHPVVTQRGSSSDRRHVVHISLGMGMGGLEKLLVEFARHVDRGRFHSSFISLQSRGRLADDIESLHCPVYALDKPLGLRPQLIWRLAKRLRQLRADVVHTHNTAALCYGSLAAALARVPRVIHTRHGQRFAAGRRENALFRWSARRVDRLVNVSQDGQQLCIDEGVCADRVCVIRNGVDIQRFPYAGPQAGGPLMTVARLSPEKDVACLIQALHLAVSTDRAAPDLCLQLVGDGPERQPLEQLVQSLGLANRVVFWGERDDVAQLLTTASMFILPSKSEGVSLTLLEAMARGLPVIATSVGGNPEVVLQGRTGLLVPSQDPTALAEAILKLHREPQLGIEFGRNGRRRVEQEFSIEHMIRAYEREYWGEVRHA